MVVHSAPVYLRVAWAWLAAGLATLGFTIYEATISGLEGVLFGLALTVAILVAAIVTRRQCDAGPCIGTLAVTPTHLEVRCLRRGRRTGLNTPAHELLGSWCGATSDELHVIDSLRVGILGLKEPLAGPSRRNQFLFRAYEPHIDEFGDTCVGDEFVGVFEVDALLFVPTGAPTWRALLGDKAGLESRSGRVLGLILCHMQSSSIDAALQRLQALPGSFRAVRSDVELKDRHVWIRAEASSRKLVVDASAEEALALRTWLGS